MRARHIYRGLAAAGLLLPLSVFAPWLVANGPDVALLMRELFSTRVGAFFGWDVIVSGFAVVVVVVADRPNRRPHARTALRA